MEEQRRKEIGQRMKELRERSPYTQDDIAEMLGVKPRTYQRQEERGTTKFALVERLAEIHQTWTSRSDEWAFVDADWIWDGKRDRAKQAQPLADRMLAVEQKLDYLLKALGLEAPTDERDANERDADTDAPDDVARQVKRLQAWIETAGQRTHKLEKAAGEDQGDTDDEDQAL